MLEIGETHTSRRTGSTFRIVSRSAESMSFERDLKPNSGRIDPHRHLDFTQTWELLDGEATVMVDGETRPMVVGEPVPVPPGVAHRDPFTAEVDATIRGTFEPCPEFVESYAEALAYHMERGTLNRHDELPLAQIFALSAGTEGETYRAGVPISLQKAALPLMTRIAKLRGFPTEFA